VTVTYFAAHAWLPGGLAASVRVAVDRGRIVTVAADAQPDPDDVRLPGVVFAGFANVHSHAFHRALRGRTNGGTGTFWTWRERMYEVASRLNPDSYLALARATFAEMALAGVTCVGEFHYLHHAPRGVPYADANAMGAAVMLAAREAGIRITLLDTCYLAGGLAAAGHLPLDETQHRFSDGTAERWAARWAALHPAAHARVGAAIHSVRAVPRDQLGEVVAAAAGHPLHVHLSEQPAENEQCRAHYGCTPTELLGTAAALGPLTTAVHATHLTLDDVAQLGAARTSIGMCPTTERDLADGIGPARALAAAGCPVTLGSDQHAVIDLLEEARALEADERLASGQRGRFTPAELVTALTTAGHACLGWPDAGRIEVGARADLVAVRNDSVRTAGTHPAEIVLAATAADVDTVIVDGRAVVDGGRHVLGDVGPLLTDAITALDSS
jgi:formiminoglutamate deiminase